MRLGPPNKTLEPTPIYVGRSAFAVDIMCPEWLSFGR